MNLRATLWIVLLTVAGTVNAETAKPADLARAQAYVDLSATLFKAQDFAGALDALERAAPLLVGEPSLSVARFNIARCLEELGRPADAAAAYDQYLASPDDARRQQRAREALARLTSTTVATLGVSCVPDDARVRIGDGEERDCPTEFRVPGGPAVIRASATNFVPSEYDVIAAAGARTDVVVELQPSLTVPAAIPGPAIPGEQVDRLAPAARLEDADKTAAAPLPSRVLPYTLIGVATTSIGLGVAFHVLAADKRDDAGHEQYGSKRDSLTSDFETRRAVAFAAYGIGLLSGCAGAYLLLRSVDEPSQTLGVGSNGIRVSW
jgi:hypothetical protein